MPSHICLSAWLQERDELQVQMDLAQSRYRGARQELDQAKSDHAMEVELLNQRLRQAAQDLDEVHAQVRSLCTFGGQTFAAHSSSYVPLLSLDKPGGCTNGRNAIAAAAGHCSSS